MSRRMSGSKQARKQLTFPIIKAQNNSFTTVEFLINRGK